MSEYGVKIKKIKAGSLYETQLGVRKYFSYQNAMFTNNLLLDFLLENGLKVQGNSTKDIISIDFDFGTRSYQEHIKFLDREIASDREKGREDRALKLEHIKEEAEANKDLYKKVSIEDIRIEYYTDGVDVEYITYKKDGSVKKVEKIHYKMLYRSAGKAKKGSCVFICQRLYKKAHKFIYMGLRLPKRNAPIVEMSAYCSLVTSTIVDRIKIDPKNILVLNDVDSFFKTKVVSVETDKSKSCVAKGIDEYELKNTIFDGQGLIDSSIFPEWGNGYILLRHHMCKMACFNANIQDFFRDYYGDKYDTATVTDMFGTEHNVKDIQLITTDNAMKWLKFDVSYEYWCDRVYENECNFGIVKTAHKSKLGNVQKMSYQMVNSLDLEIMPNVAELSIDYIHSLKKDNDVFLQYLRDNQNFSNDYEVLVALVEQDREFLRSEYFRARKKEIIRSYTKLFRTGKVVQNADNLTIVGSPYAMLLHSVGEPVEKDDTFAYEQGTIQCFTSRFDDGQYLAEFRNPFNSKNNMGYLHNVYSDKMLKYFNFTDEIIAVNMLGTDFQDRNNGADQDSDSIYCTDHADIVEYAKHCYLNYPTIVNNIPKEKNVYDNTLEHFALIDNNLAEAQLAIGESSNLAQIALTYTYNFSAQKYQDYVCILSVLAQVAIDNAKRRFDIDLNSEIKRIKKDMDIGENGYPAFWKLIRPAFNHTKINKNLKCPMNHLGNVKIKIERPTESTLPMSHFFNKFKLEEDRRKCKKVEKLIETYSFDLYNHRIGGGEESLVMQANFDQMIEDIKKVYISKNYLGLMSWLIDRAFCITAGVTRNYGTKQNNSEQNKAILLKCLYDINPQNLLKVFNKSAKTP